MKAYIITEGVYSGYHICGVTLDKDKAKMMKRFYSNEYDLAQIEEWDIDEYQQIYMGMKLYNVKRLTNGTVTVGEAYYKEPPFFKVLHNRYGYSIYVFAIDEEQAKRIALDKIAEFKYRKSMGETK